MGPGQKFAKVVTETIQATASTVFAANFVINLLLAASLNQLWSTIHTQQIIVLMPLFKVNLPGNAAVFFNVLMTVASFDVLPTDNFYDKVLNTTPTLPLTANFEAVGFESMYFLYNMGSLMVLLMVFALLAIISWLFSLCKKVECA